MAEGTISVAVGGVILQISADQLKEFLASNPGAVVVEAQVPQPEAPANGGKEKRRR